MGAGVGGRARGAGLTRGAAAESKREAQFLGSLYERLGAHADESGDKLNGWEKQDEQNASKRAWRRRDAGRARARADPAAQVRRWGRASKASTRCWRGSRGWTR